MVGLAGLATGATLRFCSSACRAAGDTWWEALALDHPLPVIGLLIALGAWYWTARRQARRSLESLSSSLTANAGPFLFGLVNFLAPLQDRWFAGDISDLLAAAAIAGTGGLLWLRTAGARDHEINGSGHWRNFLLIAAVTFILSAVYCLDVFGPRAAPSGDEPSYLMITRSLQADRDISMDNNYRFKDYRLFGVNTYPVFTHLGKDRVNYPHHSIGLPLYLAPWLAVSLRLEPRPLVLVMRFATILVAIICFIQVYLLAALAIPARRARTAVLIGVSTTPMLFYASEIYPELAAALCAAYSLRLLLADPAPRGAAWRAGLAMAFLPWLGVKYIALLGALVLVWTGTIIRRRRGRRPLYGLGFPLAVSTGLYMAFLYNLYGNFSPTSIYKGVIPGAPDHGALLADIQAMFGQMGFRLRGISELFTGIWLEQRIGLLFLAPVFILIAPGIVSLWKKNRGFTASLLPPILAHLFIYGYESNWGGYCPVNRPVVTALALALPLFGQGLAVADRGRTLRILKWILLGLSWLVAYCFLLYPPWLYHTLSSHIAGGAGNLFRAFDYPGLRNLPDWLPLIMGDIKHYGANLTWGIVLALLIGVFMPAARRGDRPNPRSAVKSAARSWTIAIAGGLVLALAWRLVFPPLTRRSIEPPASTQVIRLNVLDGNHFGDELRGGWLKGGAATAFRIITPGYPKSFSMAAHSLVDNRLHINLGGRSVAMAMLAREPVRFSLTPRTAIHRFGAWHTRVYAACDRSFTAAELIGSEDRRRLGVFLFFD
ncbi:hypothetical protein JW905_13230 [bacterium]|nr:hypothetical protein [candidate division CSSED10-310 bacterium]